MPKRKSSPSSSNDECVLPEKVKKSDENSARFTEKSASISVTESLKSEIKELFHVILPENFYEFFSFCQDFCGSDINTKLSSYGIKLAGPFDYILGKYADKKDHYVLHHRFYYDTPEFQTVLLSTDNMFLHIGYLRDNIEESACIVASNDASKDCRLNILGDNLFSAVLKFINKNHKSKKFCEALEKEIARLGHQTGINTKKIKSRSKNIVSRMFHTAGLVVPVDSNGIGYREIPRTPAELRVMFSSISGKNKDSNKHLQDLEEIMTYVQFANDECDPGQGYELGLQLFLSGHENLDKYIKSLLPMAYMLLRYDEFNKIFNIHIESRVKTFPSYLIE